MNFAKWYGDNKERLTTLTYDAALFEAWKAAKSTTSKEFVDWIAAIHITAHCRAGEFDSWIKNPQ